MKIEKGYKLDQFIDYVKSLNDFHDDSFVMICKFNNLCKQKPTKEIIESMFKVKKSWTETQPIKYHYFLGKYKAIFDQDGSCILKHNSHYLGSIETLRDLFNKTNGELETNIEI